jgi:hypothetical protein
MFFSVFFSFLFKKKKTNHQGKKIKRLAKEYNYWIRNESTKDQTQPIIYDEYGEVSVVSVGVL